MCSCSHSRRSILGMLATAPLLAGCKPATAGPEDIRWGRETCTFCGMIISDARYAAELRGGADRKLYKFDDIGCAVHWLTYQPWRNDPETEFWVMDSNSGTDWLDAREASYFGDTISPMDYGFAAVSAPEPDSVGFGTMVLGVMAKGLDARCTIPEES